MEGPEFRERSARHSRSRTTWRIFSGLASAALIASAAFVAGVFIQGDPRFAGLFDVSRGAGPGTAQSAPSGQPGLPAAEAVRTDTPPPGVEEQDEPLGLPQKPAVASDSYKFLAVNDDGTPVGYSPCRPLHYVVNTALTPEGAERLVAHLAKRRQEQDDVYE